MESPILETLVSTKKLTPLAKTSKHERRKIDSTHDAVPLCNSLQKGHGTVE